MISPLLYTSSYLTSLCFTGEAIGSMIANRPINNTGVRKSVIENIGMIYYVNTYDVNDHDDDAVDDIDDGGV